MKIVEIQFGLREQIEAKQKGNFVTDEAGLKFSEVEREAILKKHTWRSFSNGEKDFTVYTKRFESVYTKITKDIFMCRRTPADTMGTHGRTENKFFKVS